MSIDVKKVGTDLQDTLIELIDLALQAKQAHWNVTGPFFKPLHEQLDELTDDVRAASDDVAERAAAIGYAPDGRVTTVAKESTLLEFPEDGVADAEVVRLITERLTLVAERVRERMNRLGDLDPVTQDLLIEVLKTLEKHRWMFAVQQR